MERELKDERGRLGEQFTNDDAVRWRQTRAGPILTRFAGWLEVQVRTTTPKCLFGQAVNDVRNQWPSLVRYLDDARLAIDNGAAERAIRPIAVSRANWLQIGGDGGLPTASVLLSVCASARRNGLDLWAYLTHVLSDLTVRAAGEEAVDPLPDNRTKARGQNHHRVA